MVAGFLVTLDFIMPVGLVKPARRCAMRRIGRVYPLIARGTHLAATSLWITARIAGDSTGCS